MHKQKLMEARKQTEMIENKKFFQDSHIRALKEKRWTSETAVNNRYKWKGLLAYFPYPYGLSHA